MKNKCRELHRAKGNVHQANHTRSAPLTTPVAGSSRL